MRLKTWQPNPCSSQPPFALQELLRRSGTPIKGAEVVVVGRSNIVGKPIAAMLMQKSDAGNATVTVCHTGTKDIAYHTKRVYSSPCWHMEWVSG